MKTDSHIDWLSITIPTSANWRQFIPFVDLIENGHGRHGYGKSYVDRRTGARIETASARDDMGTHLTLSGDVLAAMRDDLGMIDDALVRRIEQYDGKCSRIDLAIDIVGSSLEPGQLAKALKSGDASIHARTWRFIEGHKNGIDGDTLDTGSPKSDKRFRFYDKRAEMRIKDGEAWVRLELQLRRMYARQAVENCSQHGSEAVIGASIGKYLEWSDTEYRAVLAAHGTIGLTMPRSVSNRQKWLLGQVASALADECLINPYFRETFNIAVNGFIEQRSHRA